MSDTFIPNTTGLRAVVVTIWLPKDGEEAEEPATDILPIIGWRAEPWSPQKHHLPRATPVIPIELDDTDAPKTGVFRTKTRIGLLMLDGAVTDLASGEEHPSVDTFAAAMVKVEVWLDQRIKREGAA
jgi:hypothetical protein